MRTQVSPSWSNPDLTGNSTVVQVGSEIYLVSNLDTGSFSVLKSIDNGASFSAVSEPIPTSTPSFDPAIFYDPATNVIHILGTRSNISNPKLYDLLYFKYMVGGSSITPPLFLASTEYISAYDLALDPANPSDLVIVTSLSNSPQLPPPPYLNDQYLVDIVIDTVTSAVSSPSIILATPNLVVGETYGGVSLVADTSALNVFFVSHPAVVGESQHFIHQYTRSGSSWSATKTFSYTAYFSDDKLTVVPFLNGLNEVEMMLSHCFYKDRELTPNSVVAYYDGAVWSPLTIMRDASGKIGSFFEPTISVDNTGKFTLAYLVKPQGLFQIVDINKLTMETTPTATWTQYASFYYSYLRGSKGIVGAANGGWLVIPMTPSLDGLHQISYLQSGLHQPPVAIITSPPTNLVRGVASIFSASHSSSSDDLPLTYTWLLHNNYAGHPADSVVWAVDGDEATLLINKDFGPLDWTFQIDLTVTDAALSSSSATALPYLDINNPPVVSWDINPIPSSSVQRGSVLTVVANVNDPENDSLIYTWTQLSGSGIAWTNEDATLLASIVGTNLGGEDLVFNLSVSDSISPPQTPPTPLTISVPPRAGSTTEDTNLARTMWSGTLGSRNTNASWSSPAISAFNTDYFKVRSSLTSDGNNRQILIATGSVTILGDGENDQPYAIYYRRRFLADESQLIQDAWQTEQDSTLVLAKNGLLYRYDIPGDENCSDGPQFSIDLNNRLSPTIISSISEMLVSRSVDGKRLATFSTDYGLFLLEIEEANGTFSMGHSLMLTTDNYLLLGGNKVTFVRFVEAGNLKVGKLLIGTTDGTQQYETLLDLASERILHEWNQTIQINANTITGEIL